MYLKKRRRDKGRRLSSNRLHRLRRVVSAAKRELAQGRYNRRMEISWITPQIGVGGAIWREDRMIELVQIGVTHILNMQLEFDDRHLAGPYDIPVCWVKVDDDYLPKPAETLKPGLDFALEVLRRPETKLYIHCAAGIHRSPMMALAVLRAQGLSQKDAQNKIKSARLI